MAQGFPKKPGLEGRHRQSRQTDDDGPKNRVGRWAAPPLVQTSHHGQVERLKPAWKPKPEDNTDFSGLLPPKQGEDEEGPGGSQNGSTQASGNGDGQDAPKHLERATRGCSPTHIGLHGARSDSGGHGRADTALGGIRCGRA